MSLQGKSEPLYARGNSMLLAILAGLGCFGLGSIRAGLGFFVDWLTV